MKSDHIVVWLLYVKFCWSVSYYYGKMPGAEGLHRKEVCLAVSEAESLRAGDQICFDVVDINGGRQMRERGGRERERKREREREIHSETESKILEMVPSCSFTALLQELTHEN